MKPRSSDKRRVVLAAAALASAADEPASDYEGAPMAGRAPVAAAARCPRVQLRATEAAESAAHSLVAGRPSMELAQLLDGETERPTRELVTLVKEISKIVLTKGTFYNSATARLIAGRMGCIGIRRATADDHHEEAADRAHQRGRQHAGPPGLSQGLATCSCGCDDACRDAQEHARP